MLAMLNNNYLLGFKLFGVSYSRVINVSYYDNNATYGHKMKGDIITIL